MAPSSDADEPNDVASSDPLTEDTTAIKKLSLNSSIGTLTSPSSSSTRTLTPPSSSYSIVTLTLPLPTLPFDLIVEILYKLPVKSLMQFQCVCKSWKSLISDPNFAKKHLHMSTKHHHPIFADYVAENVIHMDYPLTSVFTEVTAMQLEYPLPIGRRFHPIVGSCHGILCIAINNVSVLLWNPSIRKFTKLPCLDETPRPVHDYEFSFGYDHSSDSYKVAFFKTFRGTAQNCARQTINHEVPRIKQPSSTDTDKYCTVDIGQELHPQYDLSGKFVCGTVNRLTSRYMTSSWHIISLDLEKESYLEIVQPDHGGVTLTSLRIGVLRDCLCIFSRSRSYPFTDIWLMKEYGIKESWIKLFRVPDIRDFGPYSYVCALYVSEDDQVLLEIDSHLFVYNSRDGTLKDLNIQNTNA
ncbi:hypothetical protein TSUD_381750 [Trifolium subterraneum]|uniref:F-box domain-containing protein n=1 Tax=Trifolium subterraneum TaxID=3900 RepID=A0A2Z6MD37_TRISU|nr:hypothetical protein TSUD_381750 [Trifolium subterraneum]